MNAENEPAAQSKQAAAPAAEYVPAAHGTHFVIPVFAAYVPAGQFCKSVSQHKHQSIGAGPAHSSGAAIRHVEYAEQYLALIRGFGARVVVVSPRRTRLASSIRRGPGVRVVRACRAFRAGDSRRGAGPVVVGTGRALQASCTGRGPDAGAVGACRTSRTSGDGGGRSVAVVGTLAAQSASTCACNRIRASNTVGTCYCSQRRSDSSCSARRAHTCS